MRYLEVIRFLLVGAASALTQFVFLAFLFEVCSFSLNWAASMAYVASVIVHFFGNKNFTFRSAYNTDATEVLRYLSVVLLNYMITICIMWIFVGALESNPYTATMASIVVTFGIGFVISKLWVFKQ